MRPTNFSLSVIFLNVLNWFQAVNLIFLWKREELLPFSSGFIQGYRGFETGLSSWPFQDEQDPRSQQHSWRDWAKEIKSFHTL